MQITTSWHEKGRAEGIKEGEIKKALETAQAALKKGLAEDVVVEITGLNREDVKRLRDELN